MIRRFLLLMALVLVAAPASAHDHLTIEQGEACESLVEPFLSPVDFAQMNWLKWRPCDNHEMLLLTRNPSWCGNWDSGDRAGYKAFQALYNGYVQEAYAKMNRCRNFWEERSCTNCHTAWQFRRDEVKDDPEYARPTGTHPGPR
jgi:hypothetical protein